MTLSLESLKSALGRRSPLREDPRHFAGNASKILSHIRSRIEPDDAFWMSTVKFPGASANLGKVSDTIVGQADCSELQSDRHTKRSTLQS